MIKALYTSATGLDAQQAMLDNTANNLANSNTTAFKRSEVDFHDLLYETKRAPGADGSQGNQAPTGYQVGSGVRIAGNSKIFSAGAVSTTNNPLDIAIQGDGFFQVTLPSGELRYTRDGSFQLNSTGNLVTSDGFLLTPTITVPQDTVSIAVGTDGTVSVTESGSPGKSNTVGNISLVRFANDAGMSSEGNNLYSATPSSGAPQVTTPGLLGTGTLLQNSLEQSNVNVVAEMVNLITAQRAYELNTRAIKVADEMLSSANNLVT
jgi:flagellar basal-body rod protein FlgG